MTPKKLSGILVIALAVIAAVVAVGLIAGINVYPIIVIYWTTLTSKNIVDCISVKRGTINEEN